MRKFLSLVVLTFASLSNAQAAETSDWVFMFIPDGSRDLELMLTEEVGLMREMLEDAGFSVDIATTDNKVLEAGGATLEPTIALENVYAANYAGIILPCMAPAPGSHSTPDAVTAIVEQAVALGRPVAASRGSVATLARAGALVGKQYAYAGPVDLSKRPEFAGGEYQGIGVVRDGMISTAGICPLAARSTGEPDGTEELTEYFIATLEEAD